MVRRSRSRPLLLLGMHRSGTSALAGVLRLLGVELGSSLMPPNKFNPRGYWEHQEIVDLHERLLCDLGSHWHDTRPLPSGWWRHQSIRWAHDALRDLIERDFHEEGVWAIKDPRMCRLLPLWQSLLHDLRLQPSYVLMLRHPAEVAQSLARRDGFPAGKSFSLWLQHTLAAEADSRGHRRVIVRFEDLRTDWTTQVRRMGRALSLVWPKSPKSQARLVDQFLSADLVHHDHRETDHAGTLELPTWVERSYAFLSQHVSKPRPATLGKLTTMRRNLEQASSLFGYTEESRKPRMAEQNQELETAIHREDSNPNSDALSLGSTEEALRQSEERAATLERELEERTAWAKSLDRDLRARDQRILSLQNEVEETTEWGQNACRDALEKHGKIRQLQKQVHDLSQQAASLQASMEELQTAEGKLQQDLVAAQRQTASARDDANAQEETIRRLQLELADVREETVGLRGKLEDLKARDQLADETRDLVTTLRSELDATVASLARRVDELEGGVTDDAGQGLSTRLLDQEGLTRWHGESIVALRRSADEHATAIAHADRERIEIRQSITQLQGAVEQQRIVDETLDRRLARAERATRHWGDRVQSLEAAHRRTTQLVHMLWVSRPWQTYLGFKQRVRALLPKVHDSLAAPVPSDSTHATPPATTEPGPPAPPHAAEHAAAPVPDVDHRQRVLMIDHRVPTPDKDSGSLRTFNFLKLLQRDFGFRVSLIPENLFADQPYTSHLEAQGIEVLTRPPLTSVHEHLEQRGPEYDWVVLSRAPFAARFIDDVRALCPRAKIIFDTVDLHYVREMRQAEHENDASIREQAEHTKAQELATAVKADATLVVSSFEKEVLKKDAPGLNVHIVSNIHHVQRGTTPFEQRKHVMFIGGFEHTPNVDAATWLVNDIWPLVRHELPSVHLYIVGSKPTPDVEALRNEHITVTGHVPDVAPYFETCRLSVAPLRFGAGVKGKVNQSMAHGLPCVVTRTAAEGMQLRHGVEALIADEPSEFAAHVVELYRNEELWTALSKAGLENVQQHFSFEAARRALSHAFQSIAGHAKAA